MTDPTPIPPEVSPTPVVQTTTVSTATGPTPPVPDDKIRREVARETLLSEGVVILAVLYLLFFKSGDLNKEQIAAVFSLIGTIIGYKARDTGTVIGYLFGSSSGSTLKSAQGK